MDNYLTTHYKGKYRVRANYDQSTNDFVRDAEGNLDDSFGDFYLLGKAGIEIKHGTGSELACYIPRLGTGYRPGKFHGWRSLVGYSLWGCKESDMTE